MPVPLGTNAAHLRTVGRGSLLIVILLAPVTLAWPSIAGWTALAIALVALLGVWLLYRSLAGRTRVPSHWMHVALLSLWLLGAFHVFRGGMNVTDVRPRPLAGQFEASLATQAALIALMVLLTQDWLAHAAFVAVIPTALGLTAIAGAFGALLVGDRPDSRLMIAMMGWTGAAMVCRPLWGALTGPPAPADSLLRRLLRRVRLGIALLTAAGLSVLCPPSTVLALGAVAVTLGVASILVRRHPLRYVALALLAGVVAGAHAHALGWLSLPAWPHDAAGWIGLGDGALAHKTPSSSDLALLIDAVGWGGVAWLIGCLLIGLTLAMRAAIRADMHGRALLGGLTLVLATTAWLAPGGLFSPGINVLLAAVWGFWPITMGRQDRLRSGWWAFGLFATLTLILGLVGRIGLLSWMATSLGGKDMGLHLLMGWIMAQMLLWLLSSRRHGVVMAVTISVMVAALGEALQALLSSRTAEWHDFFGHLQGTALATMLYLIARVSLWSESPDLPAKAPQAQPSEPTRPF